MPDLISPAVDGVVCDRCGRMFERPVTGAIGGERVTLRGHVKGDPVLCIPDKGKVTLDARERRKARERWTR